ncbi:hypothetical protein [Streptomyces sp. LN785]|uniref:hypothetical protein n=1 Tax=Streptomyces sp. LN785 TaxID=3112983 RepID=UPI0037153EDE
MRILPRVAVAIASLMSLVGLTSTPASAAGHDMYIAYADGFANYSCYNEYGNQSGGAVGFLSYGEHLSVSDTCKDGKSTVGVVNVGSSFYYYWNHGGAGTTRSVDLSFDENLYVAIQGCLGDWEGTPTGGLARDTCGSVTYGTA